MTNSHTPLADAMRRLAFEFKLRSGEDATHILLPKKALRSEVKPFIEALCAETGAGHPPRVFDRIVNGEGEQCSFCDMVIAMYDGSHVVVGRADPVH